MSYSQVFAISAAGMGAERVRLDVAAMNLANANTATAPGEAGYRPMRVAIKSGYVAGGDFAQAFSSGIAQAPYAQVEHSVTQSKMLYEPEHPMADKRGYVSYPEIDNATEMITIMSAMRSYEANITALNAAKNMAMKTLEIGGQS